MISCVLSPYLLAFNYRDNKNVSYYADQTVNSFFMIDTVLNFFTAFYTDDLEIIDDQKVF